MLPDLPLLAITCHWLPLFLLPCWSGFLPRSQSFGLCTVHFMWWMHKCFSYQSACVLVHCPWVASFSIPHLSSVSAYLYCLFNSCGCFVHSHLCWLPFFWFWPWHQFWLSLLTRWVESFRSLSSLSWASRAMVFSWWGDLALHFLLFMSNYNFGFAFLMMVSCVASFISPIWFIQSSCNLLI